VTKKRFSKKKKGTSKLKAGTKKKEEKIDHPKKKNQLTWKGKTGNG